VGAAGTAGIAGRVGTDVCASDVPGRAVTAVSVLSLLSAAAGALSPLYYVARPFGWLIFVSRFLGLGAVAAAGVRIGTGATAQAGS
jgi:hypothetical protein